MSPRLTATPLIALALIAARASAADPNNTIAESEQVLAELLAIPGRQIPARLLNEAQGVALIPRVIKVGFIAGVRRGHGVMLARDQDGQWSLPRFVRLTGGSIGWQAGVQGTDVVLVFRTRGSVERLMRGKFTVGVDAAAAAGPVGRNVAAATDTSLSAEILSYSRSRGLFLGASIDGSSIEIDRRANTAFYQSSQFNAPQVIPLAATRLQATITALTGGQPALITVPPVTAAPVAPAGATVPTTTLDSVMPAIDVTEIRTDALRRALVTESADLADLLTPDWQAFLALPPDVQNPAAPPNAAEVAALLTRFDQVAADGSFAELTARPEFRSTHELLREYSAIVRPEASKLRLPPPPPLPDVRR